MYDERHMIGPYLRLALTACCASAFLTVLIMALMITAADKWSWPSILAVMIYSILPGLICLTAFKLLSRSAPWFEEISRQQARYLDRIKDRYVELLLVLAAGVSLYAELCMIRWQSTVFPLFALYKNFSLLACFAGLGLGYASSDRRHIPLIMTPVLLVWQMAALRATRAAVPSWCSHALQTTPVSEQLDMGLYKYTSIWANIPSYVLLAVVFLLTALAFIPMGQLCGRLMERGDKLRAYGANLVGSLLGVVLMFAVSWLWTPPVVWFGLVFGFLLVFFTYRGTVLLTGGLATMGMTLVLSWPVAPDVNQIHSPYQLLECTTKDDGRLQVLAAGHYFQRVYDLSYANRNRRTSPELRQIADYYEFPYRVVSQPGRVAIVGSGTGNDVAAALRMGAARVDAVEIDPGIVYLGRKHHPERPYDDQRVAVIVNDARTHFRTAPQRYDMIVYGLLDSHSLLSHASNVRLDSFVYTVEGFREAFQRLEQGGALVVSFCCVSNPAIGRKIYTMMMQASGGGRPVCCEATYDQAVIFLLRKGARTVLPPQLVSDTGFKNVTSVYADGQFNADPSTDDWPFVYMPKRVYPISYLPMALLILVGSLLLIAVTMRGGERADLRNLDFFCLGAGFMLVETKAITELGLTFGNTWQVVGIAIVAILGMAFLANAAVLRFSFRRVSFPYAALLALLALGFLVARNGGLPSTMAGRLAAVVLLTSPMFFAGMVFSTLLSQSVRISGAMCANLLGSIVGGLLEYNSMYFGFANLYLFAIALYGLALVCSHIRFAGAARQAEVRVPTRRVVEPATAPDSSSVA